MDLTRREWLALAPAAVGMPLAAPSPAAKAADRPPEEPFLYGLNTSTLRGYQLPITKVIDLAAQAGYHGLEPWVREIDAHVQAGGAPEDLAKRIQDRGLSVESAIGFFEWAVDDEAQRQKGFEEARRSMDLVRRIGGRRLAAPPSGATDRSDIDPRRLAERYRALLELGDAMGVIPEVEVWGFSKTLQTLGEAALVALNSGHPKACLLPDVYHLYKGGSSFETIPLLSGRAIPVFHFNDYPASPPRATITDAHRVYPGDGIAPLKTLVRDLRTIGFQGMLSLELFNKEYWKQEPLTVARTGLEKMRAVVRSSLA
ncbi:MAG: sugar phosphate isomerase/epimerase [Isosphaeraceae bacterium]|nr:sugar phosphate isomerase/epimerase [Isosphaeraceae bacterium]